MDAQSIVSEMEFYNIHKYMEIKQQCACTCLRTYVRFNHANMPKYTVQCSGVVHLGTHK